MFSFSFRLPKKYTLLLDGGKRAPVDDMGNNRLPSNKTGVIGLGSPTTQPTVP